MRNLHNIFCPTSPFAAGPQGNLLVIKVLLLKEYRSKALALSENMWSSYLNHPLQLSQVPEQELLTPETCLRWRRSCGTLSGIWLIVLGFSGQEHYIGERAARGGGRVVLPTWWRHPPTDRATAWWGGRGPPLDLPFWLRGSSGEIEFL